MISGSLKWYTVAKMCLDAAQANLTIQVDRATVVPGAIAWDACDCGALYASVGLIYPSENFPEQQTTRDLATPCMAPYETGEIIVQIMRCAPQPQGQNSYPDAADEDASAQTVRRDAYEIMQAVAQLLCGLQDQDQIESFIIDTQVAAGPGGGCVGTELRFRVGLDRG